MFRAGSWGASCSACTTGVGGGGVEVVASIDSICVDCVDGGSNCVVMESGDGGFEGGLLVDVISSVNITSSTGVNVLFILPVIASIISCAATLKLEKWFP